MCALSGHSRSFSGVPGRGSRSLPRPPGGSAVKGVPQQVVSVPAPSAAIFGSRVGCAAVPAVREIVYVRINFPGNISGERVPRRPLVLVTPGRVFVWSLCHGTQTSAG